MLNYIINLPVYNVQDSVSISDARKIILQLAKPIAEVTRNIQVNIKLADDKQKEINNLEFHGLCDHCKNILDWKVKYKKYKPLTMPKKW